MSYRQSPLTGYLSRRAVGNGHSIILCGSQPLLVVDAAGKRRIGTDTYQLRQRVAELPRHLTEKRVEDGTAIAVIAIGRGQCFAGNGRNGFVQTDRRQGAATLTKIFLTQLRKVLQQQTLMVVAKGL